MDGDGRVMRASAALAGLAKEFDAAVLLPHRSDTEWAVRSERLALVCARQAGWWSVLAAVWAVADADGVFVRAAVIARGKARDGARFWRECARDWRGDAQRSESMAADWDRDCGVWGVAS